ncbi:MAG: response regulator [Methanoregulaceae archaeon]
MADDPGGTDKSPRVLYVEDSRTQAEILKEILERQGFHIGIANNGEVALTLLKKTKPDLVISDIVMPEMDGFELCSAIKNDPGLRDLPVILLTTLSDTKDVALALEAGADNIITKPYQMEYLVSRIRKTIASGKAACQQGAPADPVEVTYGSQTFRIPSDRRKIIEFLLSAYDVAVIKQREVVWAQKELKRSNTSLSNLNQIISECNSSLDPDTLVKTVLEKTVNLFRFDMGAVYLPDENGTSALLQSCSEIAPPDEAGRSRSHSLDLTLAPCQDVFISGTPRYYTPGDSTGSTGWEKILGPWGGMQSAAFLPLKSSDQITGALLFTSLEKHAFSEEEKSILESIGKEVGSAVQNGLLRKRIESANEEMSLYLDIMTHDINNVNTALLAKMELLSTQQAPDLSRKITELVRTSVNQTLEIIGNVSTIRMLHEKKAALRPVSLDAAIRKEIDRFSSGNIRYYGTQVQVIADELLGQVLTNLIGNSTKFGGTGVEITVYVLDRKSDVEVIVADTGPGIPDDMKPRIFDRFRKGTGSKSGKGLGLFITRKLIEIYGGTIRATDRVPGQPEAGAAIHFTLKKAE